MIIDKLSIATNQPSDLKVAPVKSVQKIKDNSDKQLNDPKIVLSKEKAEKVVNSINEFLKGSNTQLVFKYHEGLNEYYAAVVDEFTNQVIREIPPKKLLDIFASMKDYLGLLIDKKA